MYNKYIINAVAELSDSPSITPWPKGCILTRKVYIYTGREGEEMKD